VNLLVFEDQRYLVAPRGQTQWVRNLRVAGQGELRVGRRTETFRATELGDDEKVDVLRAYLGRWKAGSVSSSTASAQGPRTVTFAVSRRTIQSSGSGRRARRSASRQSEDTGDLLDVLGAGPLESTDALGRHVEPVPPDGTDAGVRGLPNA
jgi:hypothetical protein